MLCELFHTSNGVMFVAFPEVVKLLLNIFQKQSSSLLVVHLYVVSFEDQLHITASVVIEGLPALAHHPIDSHVVS